MQKIRVVTLGCSKNTVDTEHLLGALPREAFEVVDGNVRPDVLLVNTCGFIGDAKEESVQAVLEAVEAKKRGECDRVAVFGCLSQRYSSELPGLIPEVDAWFGARDLSPIVEWLGAPVSCCTKRYQENPRGYAYVKISEGCDRRCSYCAIPHIRGAHRSVPMEDIVAEARALASEGVKELILIAQDTTCYGLDLYGRRALAELLERLSAIDGISWIRIHYSYPDDFPEDVIDLMAGNGKICPYLDIPLQHISDKVLKNMHRKATGAQIRALIASLRERIPGVVLRTTVMVGHPGEGEAEFEELCQFVSDARFERLGAFRYSEEEGTWGAAHLEDDVPEEEKQRRYDDLMTIQSECSLQFNRSRIGTEETVLVDAVTDGFLVCRSRYESPDVDGEILVRMEEGTSENLVGSFIRVRITDADFYDLTAVRV